MKTMATVQDRLSAEKNVSVTKHAYLRARERLHWSRLTIERMAEKAFTCGIAPGKAEGPLRYFLFGHSALDNRSCPFLYGEFIYVFGLAADAVKLLTVYRAPRELLRAVAIGPKHSSMNISVGNN